MRHTFSIFVLAAVLFAALAGPRVQAAADDSILTATLGASDDRDIVLLPAYVPIQNLGVFLTAAWNASPSSASSVETGTIEKMRPASGTMPAIVPLRPSTAAVIVTPVNARSDELDAKPADIAHVQTPDITRMPEASKDAIDHVQPAVVRDAEDAAIGKNASVRPATKRLALLSKSSSKKAGRGAVYRDWQVGVPGQSMEPLISMCAQAPRKCSARIEFCGC